MTPIPDSPVLSQHRLPRFYRVSLVSLWLTPGVTFMLTLALSRGLTPALLDPRLWIPLTVMGLPALYVWHEGVDVLAEGIRVRIHLPRYYSYAELDNWYFDARPDKHVLTIWTPANRIALECRAGHLTQFPILLRALKAHLRYRNWPR